MWTVQRPHSAPERPMRDWWVTSAAYPMRLRNCCGRDCLLHGVDLVSREICVRGDRSEGHPLCLGILGRIFVQASQGPGAKLGVSSSVPAACHRRVAEAVVVEVGGARKLVLGARPILDDEHGAEPELEVPIHVAVEVPDTRVVKLDADEGPGLRQDLRGVAADRVLEVEHLGGRGRIELAHSMAKDVEAIAVHVPRVFLREVVVHDEDVHDGPVLNLPRKVSQGPRGVLSGSAHLVVRHKVIAQGPRVRLRGQWPIARHLGTALGEEGLGHVVHGPLVHGQRPGSARALAHSGGGDVPLQASLAKVSLRQGPWPPGLHAHGDTEWLSRTRELGVRQLGVRSEVVLVGGHGRGQAVPLVLSHVLDPVHGEALEQGGLVRVGVGLRRVVGEMLRSALVVDECQASGEAEVGLDAVPVQGGPPRLFKVVLGADAAAGLGEGEGPLGPVHVECLAVLHRALPRPCLPAIHRRNDRVVVHRLVRGEENGVALPQVDEELVHLPRLHPLPVRLHYGHAVPGHGEVDGEQRARCDDSEPVCLAGLHVVVEPRGDGREVAARRVPWLVTLVQGWPGHALAVHEHGLGVGHPAQHGLHEAPLQSGCRVVPPALHKERRQVGVVVHLLRQAGAWRVQDHKGAVEPVCVIRARVRVPPVRPRRVLRCVHHVGVGLIVGDRALVHPAHAIRPLCARPLLEPVPVNADAVEDIVAQIRGLDHVGDLHLDDVALRRVDSRAHRALPVHEHHTPRPALVHSHAIRAAVPRGRHLPIVLEHAPVVAVELLIGNHSTQNVLLLALMRRPGGPFP
mmetsp:Transcript_25391/g.68736  ORF Transcript_25391/g.68736 Transcript_25391/m.68736 type:complete len:798 (-) Transcript_25391:203-2596(-)